MEKVELEADRLRKLRIERDRKVNEREKAWSTQQVEEMREMEYLQQAGQNNRTNEGPGRTEEKKVQ